MDEIDKCEQWYLDTYVGQDECYNIGRDAIATTRGIPLTEETRQKISKSAIGNQRWLGKKHSEETRKKQRKSQQGKPKSDEHRAKLKEAWRTRPPVTEESREKMRQSAKNRPPPSKETLQKRSKSLLGKGKLPPDKLALVYLLLSEGASHGHIATIVGRCRVTIWKIANERYEYQKLAV